MKSWEIGSYARGDYNESSDIDIMILTDLTDEETVKYRDKHRGRFQNVYSKKTAKLRDKIKELDKMQTTLCLYANFTKNVKSLPNLVKYVIIKIYLTKEGEWMYFLAIIYVLLFIIIVLVSFAVMQIKLAGIKVKDFWTFIEANQILDKLYVFANKYRKLDLQEQVIFLSEAEKVFDAFDKVPDLLWEEEYQKYMEVLNTYKDIKMIRWIAQDNKKICNLK